MVPSGFGSETVLAAFTQMLLRVGEMAGASREAMLQHARLTEEEVADPDGRVLLDKQAAIWESITQQTPAPIGLMVGQNASPEMLGVVGHGCRQQRNVREALIFLERFRKLVGGPLIGFHRTERARLVCYKTVPLRWQHVRHFGESYCAVTASFLRLFTNGAARPLSVKLQHVEPADGDAVREVFGCPVEFRAEETAIEFDERIAEHKLPPSDPGLLGYLVKHAEALERALPKDETDLVDRARRALFDELRGGEPSADRIARKLAVSKRTLQRRLQESDLDFSALLEEARRELALRYLREKSLAVYEIAYLLGYTEPSAFFRAFKRWTGKTPREVRAEEGLAA
jgi:AraC-like DNA-binding protein